MRLITSTIPLATIIAIVMCAAPAKADRPVLTFSFSDLVGDFAAGSLFVTAMDGPETVGDVTRLDPLGNALFDGSLASGFFSLEMDISVGAGDPAFLLDGVGELTVTDVDGDTLHSPVTGIWVYNGSANFVGMIDDLAIVTEDKEFNGTSGLASLAGLSGSFHDNIMTLAFGSWFTNDQGEFVDFSDASALAQGAVVPEPATLCLLAFGALAVAGRRRR